MLRMTFTIPDRTGGMGAPVSLGAPRRLVT